MGLIKQLLSDAAHHQKRHLFVIILTCGIGLLTLWPAADEYFALCVKRVDLIQTLVEAQKKVARLERLEELAVQRSQQLAVEENKSVRQQEIDTFRGELVELTRRNGCRLRRIELAEPSRRVWREQDHPLQIQTGRAKKPAETPYNLRTQHLTLTIAGPMIRVNSFLKQLYEKNQRVHTESLSLRPIGDKRQEVILELELILFELEDKKPAVSA